MHDPTQRPDWIALDWRAAAPRVWLMTDEGSVIDTRASDSKGQNGDGFGSVLLALIGDVLDGAAPMPVIGCGTAGGQVRAPGVAVPAPPPSGEAALRIETRDPRLDLRILPGMRQGAPADMMTGEETTLAGALAARPGFDGVFCLPGAHTRWVQVSAGEIVSFRTFMTGELFALLARQSVLSSDMGEEGAWDDAAFAEAVGDAISRPQGIGAALFGIRADAVLNGLAPGAARARLAGLLIGLELSGSRPHWLGQEVLVLDEGGAQEHLARAYDAALSAQAASVRTLSDDTLTLRGLRAARDAIAAHQQS